MLHWLVVADSSDDAIVIVVEDDGWVVEHNQAARELLGIGRGMLCWDYVGALSGAEGLPCSVGCVQEALGRGTSCASRTLFTIDGKPHCLSCVPLDGRMLCIITDTRLKLPDGEQEPTPLERALLVELAAGGCAESIADKLDVSPDAVTEQIERLQARMEVPTAAALVAKAFRLGLLV